VCAAAFIVNAGWCIILNIRKTAGDYVARSLGSEPVFAGVAVHLVFQFICFKTASRKWADVLHRLGGSDGQLDSFAQVLDLCWESGRALVRRPWCF